MGEIVFGRATIFIVVIYTLLFVLLVVLGFALNLLYLFIGIHLPIMELTTKSRSFILFFRNGNNRLVWMMWCFFVWVEYMWDFQRQWLIYLRIRIIGIKRVCVCLIISMLLLFNPYLLPDLPKDTQYMLLL